MTPEFDEALRCWESGDTESALRLWKISAANGDAAAQTQMGLCYELGLGIETDFVVARKFYEAAALSGNPEAQFSLGTLYRDGRGVSRNFHLAQQLFRSAAEQGLPKAYTALASMIGSGMGTPKDSAEASRWYRLAAHRGDRDAQFMLGVLYLSGDGVYKDSRSAATWFRKAAEAGDNEAQFNLGLQYFRGEGVPRDIVMAHMWLNVSSVGGYARARSSLEAIASQMSREELSSAILMAQEFSARVQTTAENSNALCDPQRVVRSTFNSGEAESSLKVLLGDVYPKLHALTISHLLKAEAEFLIRGNVNGEISAFLYTKALENEFTHRVRNPLIAGVLERDISEYPTHGERKLVQDGLPNPRITMGQVLRILKEDSVAQGILRVCGIDVFKVVEACEPLAKLRNKIIHDDCSIQFTERFRNGLKSAFHALTDQAHHAVSVLRTGQQ